MEPRGVDYVFRRTERVKERAVGARDSVLVTSAYPLVGRQVVERLLVDRFRVVATAHHMVKPPLPTGVDVHTVDRRLPRRRFGFCSGDHHRRGARGLHDRRRRLAQGVAGRPSWLPIPGRRGDPDSDADWYPVYWMDTARAQQVLSFQYHSSFRVVRRDSRQGGLKAATAQRYRRCFES